MRSLFVIFFIFLNFFCVNLSAQSFEQDYIHFQNGITQLTSDEIIQMRDYHFVFVGGFGNELAQISGRYFINNIAALREIGVLASTIFPSSLNRVSENRRRINQQLRYLYEKGGGKPIILLGHSKGGAEVLSTVVDDPSLILEGIVVRVVPTQAVLTGNVLSDRKKDKKEGRFSKIMRQIEWGPLRGANSLMGHRLARIIRKRIQSYNADIRRQLSDAVYYVISATSAETSPSTVMAWLHGKIHSKHGIAMNDGLVATESMMVPDFGRALTFLHADHMELFASTNQRGVRERAFTNALVRHILMSMNAGPEQYDRATENYWRRLVAKDQFLQPEPAFCKFLF